MGRETRNNIKRAKPLGYITLQSVFTKTYLFIGENLLGLKRIGVQTSTRTHTLIDKYMSIYIYIYT